MILGISCREASYNPQSEGLSKLFQESSSVFGNSQQESILLPILLAKEYTYLVFPSYKEFFETLRIVNSYSRTEYNNFEKLHEFNSRFSKIESENITNEEIIDYPFVGYAKLLNEDGIVKINGEIHAYTPDRLIIIKNGDFKKVQDALSQPINDD